MIIGRDNEYVKLEERERVPDTLPTPGDVRVEITVRLQDFCGRYNGVWLAKPDLVEFVRRFEALIEAGSGEISLQAMDPNELTLVIEQRAAQGHFRLHVRLGRHQYSGATYWPTAVVGGFEVASSELPSIMSGFRTLLD